MNRVNVFAVKFVRFCEKKTGTRHHFYRTIVLVTAISHKFKQNQMKNVDFVHFSQNTNISVPSLVNKTPVFHDQKV